MDLSEGRGNPKRTHLSSRQAPLLLKLAAGCVTAGLITRATFGSRTGAVVKDLGELLRSFVLPCFIFANCAEGIDGELLESSSGVLLASLFFLATGFGVGHVVVRLARLPDGSYLVPVITFSNIIGLPLPLMVTLLDSLPVFEVRYSVSQSRSRKLWRHPSQTWAGGVGDLRLRDLRLRDWADVGLRGQTWAVRRGQVAWEQSKALADEPGPCSARDQASAAGPR